MFQVQVQALNKRESIDIPLVIYDPETINTGQTNVKNKKRVVEVE